jgi:DNA-binding winged helix-turn-helix (wHTH) protein
MEYRFGAFTLDTGLGRLTGPDGDIVLRRQAWRLLIELLDQAPALAERNDLIDRIWGHAALSPNVLPQTISELRQALGDDARNPEYIETCHGRGYRLACDVERRDITSEAVAERASFTAAGDGRRTRNAVRWAWIAAPLVVLVALAALIGWQPDSGPVPLSSGNEPAATSPGLHQKPFLLTQQSRQALIEGDLEQALFLAEAARMQAHSLGEPHRVVEAVLILSRVREQRGELEYAAQVLAATLDDRYLNLDPEDRFVLTLELAMVRRDQGRVDEAERLEAEAWVARGLSVEVSSPE